MNATPRRPLFALLLVFCVLLLMANIWLLARSRSRDAVTASGSSAVRFYSSLSEQSPNLSAEWRPAAVRGSGGSAGGIPKILHYVFKNELAFEGYRPLIRSCLDLNPDWQVFLWRDGESEKLVKDHYAYFADKYRSYGDRLEKSDSVRYMILHKYGGIYLDMDVQCLRPFDHLQAGPGFQPAATDGVAAFLGEERREQTRILYGYSFCTMNSLMGARPGHPFFQFAITRMQSMPNVNHARLSTGPDFLTHAYRSWVNCSECQTGQPVHVFPASLVSPLMDTSLVNWEQKCEPYFKAPKRPQGQNRASEDAWRAQGCAELVAKNWQFDDTDNATVAVHRFLHLGYGSQSGLKTFHLFKEFPRIKVHPVY